MCDIKRYEPSSRDNFRVAESEGGSLQMAHGSGWAKVDPTPADRSGAGFQSSLNNYTFTRLKLGVCDPESAGDASRISRVNRVLASATPLHSSVIMHVTSDVPCMSTCIVRVINRWPRRLCDHERAREAGVTAGHKRTEAATSTQPVPAHSYHRTRQHLALPAPKCVDDDLEVTLVPSLSAPVNCSVTHCGTSMHDRPS